MRSFQQVYRLTFTVAQDPNQNPKLMFSMILLNTLTEINIQQHHKIPLQLKYWWAISDRALEPETKKRGESPGHEWQHEAYV
jgi:hypothetical protein